RLQHFFDDCNGAVLGLAAMTAMIARPVRQGIDLAKAEETGIGLHLDIDEPTQRLQKTRPAEFAADRKAERDGPDTYDFHVVFLRLVRCDRPSISDGGDSSSAPGRELEHCCRMIED